MPKINLKKEIKGIPLWKKMNLPKTEKAFGRTFKMQDTAFTNMTEVNAYKAKHYKTNTFIVVQHKKNKKNTYVIYQAPVSRVKNPFSKKK